MKRVIATGTAIVALIARAGTYVLTHGGGGTPANAPISPGVTLPGQFRVISMTPAPGDRQADGSDRESLLAKPMTAQFTTETFSS